MMKVVAMSITLFVGLLAAAPSEPVVSEAVLNAPVDAVWKAFTTKAGIEAWMVAKTEFELKVGAIWRTSYNKDSNLDDDTAIHHEILSFDPGRMISYRTVKTPKGFPFPGITNTWVVVYFEPVEARRTRVVARMLGFGDDQQSQNMRAFFDRGNSSEFDKLIKLFENGVPPMLR